MTNEELREIYGEMGLTQPEMANLMGMSAVAFKRYAVKTSYQREIPPYIARFARLLLQQFRLGNLAACREMFEAEPLRKRESRKKKTPAAPGLVAKSAAAKPEQGVGPGGASSGSPIQAKPLVSTRKATPKPK